jgi:hypothetical protein
MVPASYDHTARIWDAGLILIVDETATDTSAAGDRDEGLVEVPSG